MGGVKFKDNSSELLEKFKSNQIMALTAIGQIVVEITTDYMMTRYGKPIYRTGDLMRSISYNVNTGELEVKIGSNLDYAIWVHNGTQKMSARPFLKDAITENAQIIEEVAMERLGAGFRGVNISFSYD